MHNYFLSISSTEYMPFDQANDILPNLLSYNLYGNLCNCVHLTALFLTHAITHTFSVHT